MSGKKWLFLLLSALLLVFIVWAGLNIAVDPFNAYDDQLLHWDSYTQTLNPRNSKVVYITDHFDQYDSYIIGSSSAASYLPETLNSYLDASFYNMFHYGADTQYDKQLVSYLLANDDVKHIFLVLGLNEANSAGFDSSDLTYYPHYKITGESKYAYYSKFLFASPNFAFEKLSSLQDDTILPQAFDVFLPESGTYDKRVRDVEAIGSRSSYLESNAAGFPAVTMPNALDNIDLCVENIRQIRALCEKAGTELTVVLTPVSQAQRAEYTDESLNAYFSKLASVTDYWNFSISSISGDERYFYDSTHTRNATANMVLARIFENKTWYCPDPFGVYCQAGNHVQVQDLEAITDPTVPEQHTANIPILLYHHLSETDPESQTVLHPDTFDHQMSLLKENGYQTVTFDDLIAFVEKGTRLPEKSVIITFDDGYQSNYDYAFPILQKYDYNATIFVIGCSVGHKQYYKDTEHTLTPHFGQQEIAEMLSSGLITIGSHTYDMHQWPPFETGDHIRETIVPFADESEQAYIDALTNDITLQNQLFSDLDMQPSHLLAFPKGQWTTLTNVVLKDHGYKVTVTTDATRLNTIVSGLPQSLINLGRMTIDETTSAEDILAYVSREN